MRPKRVVGLSDTKRILLAALQLTLAGLAIYIAASQIGKHADSLDATMLIHATPWLVAAGAVQALFYGVLAAHWQYITKHIEPNVSNSQWLALFAAQPYKYLPTSIFTLTFRAKYAKKLGMSVKRSSLAQLVENLSMLAAATAVVVAIWLSTHDEPALATIAFIVCLTGFVVGFEVLSRVKYGIHFPVKKRLAIFFMAVFAWIVSGIAFFLVIVGLDQQTRLVEAIGANAAAIEAGIIAVFAPGGIGIRELVYGLFNVGALVIVAWRLVTTVVDMIVGPIAWGVIRRVTTKNRTDAE